MNTENVLWGMHEQRAITTAENARWRERIAFQVKHPHYTPPKWPHSMPPRSDDVMEMAYEAALAEYKKDPAYDRKAIWLGLGLDMDTLLETVTGRSKI